MQLQKINQDLYLVQHNDIAYVYGKGDWHTPIINMYEYLSPPEHIYTQYADMTRKPHRVRHIVTEYLSDKVYRMFGKYAYIGKRQTKTTDYNWQECFIPSSTDKDTEFNFINGWQSPPREVCEVFWNSPDVDLNQDYTLYVIDGLLPAPCLSTVLKLQA
jgi:hypothetical protein